MREETALDKEFKKSVCCGIILKPLDERRVSLNFRIFETGLRNVFP